MAGKQVLTIEGVGQKGLAAIQQAFLEHHAFLCGYCTPGMILAAKSSSAIASGRRRLKIRAGVAGGKIVL